jgi:hypothetical protein
VENARQLNDDPMHSMDTCTAYHQSACISTNFFEARATANGFPTGEDGEGVSSCAQLETGLINHSDREQNISPGSRPESLVFCDT